MREWIQDASEEGNVYLIRFTHDGSHYGWQYADASGVIDVLADQAYASSIDEDHDTIMVHILTEVGPVPVTVTCLRLPSMGIVDVALSYRDPGKRGRVNNTVADRGAYKLMGA